MTLNSVKLKTTSLDGTASEYRGHATPKENQKREMPSVITLTLLHPLKETPVQHWKFNPESVIRIGRSTDNEVVLYSAVVSRRHIEIRRTESSWVLFSLGANGTYINGNKITKVSVEDGMIIRLASSGPQIQIKLSTVEPGVRMDGNIKGVPTSKGKNISKDTVIN